MVYEFKFPDVGEGITEGKLVSWKVKVGEPIQKDSPVCEVETDKAVVEIPAPVSGVVSELMNQEGDTLNVGNIFMKIDENGATVTEENEKSKESEENASKPEPIPTQTTISPEVSAQDPVQNSEPVAAEAITSSENKMGKDEIGILAIPRVRMLAKERGIELSKIKGSGVHGEIIEADLENSNMAPTTDMNKTTSSQIKNEDSTPDEINHSSKQVQEHPTDENIEGIKIVKEIPAHLLEGAEEIDVSEHVKEIVAAPSVRQLARDLGVDINKVLGTGSGGRILEEDVRRFKDPQSELSGEIAQKESKQSSVETSMVTEDSIEKATVNTIFPTQEETINAKNPESSTNLESEKKSQDMKTETEIVPLSGIRGAISHKMVESLSKTAQVTIFDEADVSDLVEFRKLEKEKLAKKGIKLTYLPFFIKACVATFRDFPKFNAVFNEEKNEFDVKSEVNIGIATDTPKGLLVPNIFNCESKSVIAISKEIENNSELARSSKLSPASMQNGTFSITSIGNLGGQFFTPILNYPQVAILGIGKITRKPVVKNEDEVAIADVVSLSLTFDHRFLDGADAARFLRRYIELIEDVEELLIE